MFIVLTLLLLLTLAFLLHLLSGTLQLRGSTRLFGSVPWLPTHGFEPHEEGRSVVIKSGEVTLRGTHFAAEGYMPRGVLIYCHELNGNRWGVMPHLRPLRAAGFDVFSFDFRGHGTSDGTIDHEPTPWPSDHDIHDLKSVIAHLSNQAGGRSLGLLGAGKGAAVALCAAAGDSRVGAVVADGLYIPRPGEAKDGVAVGDLAASRPNWVYTLLRTARRPHDLWRRFILGQRHICRFADVERLADRIDSPVLVIHGQSDAYAPLADIRALCNRIHGSVRLWVVTGVGHLDAVERDPARYHRRVVRFFRRHAEPKQSVVPVPTPHLQPASSTPRKRRTATALS